MQQSLTHGFKGFQDSVMWCKGGTRPDGLMPQNGCAGAGVGLTSAGVLVQSAGVGRRAPFFSSFFLAESRDLCSDLQMPPGLSGRVGHALVRRRKVFRGLRCSDQILTDGRAVQRR